MILLHGEKVNLRALEPEDLYFLYTTENDTNFWQVSNTQVPFSKFVLKQYLENAHQDIFTAKQLRLIIEKNSRSIGTIDLFDFDPTHQRAAVGIWIADQGERQKGYAREALKILIDYAFKQLQLKQIYCNISSINKASINLFSGLDFILVGVKKDWNKTQEGWEDELLFQRLCD